MKTLFLHGPLDGQWLDLPEPLPFYHYVPSAEKQAFEETLPAVDRVEPRFCYRLAQLACPWSDSTAHVYIPFRTPFEQVLPILLEGYRGNHQDTA